MAEAPLLQGLEDLINRRLQSSERARALLEELDSRCLRIEVRDTSLAFHLIAGADGLRLAGGFTGEPDAVLRGGPLALARLPGGDRQAMLRSEALELRGDPRIAERFSRLLLTVRPDWEEALSRLTGDVAAHHLLRGLGGAVGRLGSALQTLGRYGAEYMQDEREVLVSPAEAAAFYADIDELADAVARAQARLTRLESGQRDTDESQ